MDPTRTRRVFGARIAIVLLGVGAALVGCAKAPPSGSTEGEGALVRAEDNVFVPEVTQLSPEQRMVRMTIVNKGDNVHTFTIESLDLDSGNITPGNTKTMIFPAPKRDIEFICSIHESEGMGGILDIIEEN